MSLASSSSTAGKKKHVIVIGGGIQGTSVAYQLAKRTSKDAASFDITILEAVETASAASGKGGGFMARSWGDGSPTQRLHELAFDMYEQMASTKNSELYCDSYRKLPVLSVSPGYDGLKIAQKKKDLAGILPGWLDGTIGRISALGYGDDTAQITPHQFVHNMLAKYNDRIHVVKGTCTGIESDQGSERGSRKVTAVQYQPTSDKEELSEVQTLPADVIVVSAGPWSCAAEDWFHYFPLKLPMEGIKSTSIVWKKPEEASENGVDGTALFCGEHNVHNTHLEVYPRPNGEIYICGVGGSDHVQAQQLKQGAFLNDCDANPRRVDAAVAAFGEMSTLYAKSGELEKVQACMRPCPPDGLPYMGAIPGYEGAYINAGHNCWGIAWAPACGLAMAELIVDGECNSVDLSPFDPVRFTPSPFDSSSRRGRKRREQEVGEQW